MTGGSNELPDIWSIKDLTKFLSTVGNTANKILHRIEQNKFIKKKIHHEYWGQKFWTCNYLTIEISEQNIPNGVVRFFIFVIKCVLPEIFNDTFTKQVRVVLGGSHL